MALSRTQEKTHSAYILDLLDIYTSQKYAHCFCQRKNKALHTLNHVVKRISICYPFISRYSNI